MRLKFALSVALISLSVPLISLADVVQLQAVSQPMTPMPAPMVSPLECYNFQHTLMQGSKSFDVRALQYALLKEGWSIPTEEYGMFGATTFTAVNAFQQKYASDILKDGGAPTGIVGRMTRAKLNALYGCDVVTYAQPPVATTTPALPAKISLKIQNTILDSNGVTATFCNNSSGCRGNYLYLVTIHFNERIGR